MRAARIALLQTAFLAAAIFAAGLLVLAAGKDPLAAWSALADGAFGSRTAALNVCTKACPLLLAGLAVIVAFRAGFWNVGAEGQFILGAIATGAIGTWAAPAGGGASLAAGAHLALVVILSMAAGAGWCLVAAWLRRARGASEVITTILLNFVAAYLLAWLVHGWLMQASRAQPIGDPIAAHLRLPRLGGAGSTLHAGIVPAVLACLAAHVFFRRTERGFHFRAIGANPRASAWAGIPVEGRVALAAAISGGLAGLAGSLEVLGVLGRLFDKVSPGYGFTAIAVALLARLEPLALIPAALAFGALEAGASRLQQDAGVSHVVVLVVQAVVILGSAASGALAKRKEAV